MRMPSLHYDWIGKRLPEMHDLARAALAPLSLDDMLGSRSTPAFDALGANLGASGRVAMHAMDMWDRCGQRAFAVGPGMAEAFRMTDLSAVGSQWISAPAPCYYVALTDCPWRVWGGTRWHRLGGFYVQHLSQRPDSPKREPGIRFMMWGLPDDPRNKLDDAVYWFTIPTDVLAPTGDTSSLEELFGGSDVMSADALFPGWPPKLVDAIASDDPEVKLEHRQTIQNVFRLSVNMCLYLESESADLEVEDGHDEREQLRAAIVRAKKPGKRKKLQRRLDAARRTLVTYVGPKVEHQLAEANRESRDRSALGGRAAPRWHLVRPHWRHYWVGPKETQKRVRRWISLTERGKGEPERHVTKIREAAQ